jgi:hypothetical protein
LMQSKDMSSSPQNSTKLDQSKSSLLLFFIVSTTFIQERYRRKKGVEVKVYCRYGIPYKYIHQLFYQCFLCEGVPLENTTSGQFPLHLDLHTILLFFHILKRVWHEIFEFWFFHESVSPGPLSILLRPREFLRKFVIHH